MSFKFFLFLAIIGYIAYRINKAWLRFKKMVREVTEAHSPQNTQVKTKVVRKNDLTIIYPESHEQKSREFKGGDYIEFEEK